MEQLLLHLFGDFVLQNDYVGTTKKKKTTKGLLYCIFHCTTYAIPFLLITNWMGAFLIGFTHFLIDRWDFVGWFNSKKNFVKTRENFGFNLDRPFAISIWLYIITDNTIHLILNWFIISYFNNL